MPAPLRSYPSEFGPVEVAGPCAGFGDDPTDPDAAYPAGAEAYPDATVPVFGYFVRFADGAEGLDSRSWGYFAEYSDVVAWLADFEIVA